MDYKYALKVAIGGAFIAALFKDSGLANVMFPALGLLSTLQPDLASTIKNGWGRLLGSAIGGLIGGLILTSFGSVSLGDFLSISPFLGTLGFCLATITCETLQLGSAYTQAGFVAFLLTTGQTVTTDPWLYTYVRVSTNWIGVAIAVAIVFVFREGNPRQQLQKNLATSLTHGQRIFSLMVRNVGEAEKQEIPKLLQENNRIATASMTLFTKATYGFLGDRLERERWGEIIAQQRHLGQHLGAMFKVSDAPSVGYFQTELIQFSEHLADHCQQLSGSITNEALTVNPLIAISMAENQTLLPALASSSLDNLEKFSIFTLALHQFHQSLSQLRILIANLSHPLPIVSSSRKFSWRFFHFKPLPLAQLRYIIVIGASMGFALALMRHLFANEPLFAYLGTLGVLMPMLPIFSYGSVSLGRLFLIPPLIGSILVIFLTQTLGSFPFIVGLALFISTLICYRLKLGFLSSAGASLIVVSYFIPPDLYFAALLNILLGMVIGSLAIALVKVGDPGAKLKQSFALVFDHLGNLAALVYQSYQQGIDNHQTTAPISQAIAKLLQGQPVLKILTNQQIIGNSLAETHQKRWTQLMASEQIIFNCLTELQGISKESIQKNLVGIPPEILSEFELLCQATEAEFRATSRAITKNGLSQPTTALENHLDDFRTKLAEFCQQENPENYSLPQIVLFLSFCSYLKEISREQVNLAKLL